jgi:hypothetical protein
LSPVTQYYTAQIGAQVPAPRLILVIAVLIGLKSKHVITLEDNNVMHNPSYPTISYF